MANFNVLAIDLAKNVFQVCKTNSKGKVIYNKAVTRAQLKRLLIQESVCLVAMEACGGTHYWARYAIEQGHQVKSMSARRVKAFRQGQKTDANDALAIAIAALQPHVKSTRLLNIEDQCQQGLSRIRELLVTQKVATAKQIRDLLLDFGFPIPKGDSALSEALAGILEDAENSLGMDFRMAIESQREHLNHLQLRLAEITARLTSQIKADETCQRLQKLEGVGPVNAIALKLTLGTVEHFKNGREASACIGLTPTQHSSGGKSKIGSISKVSGCKGLRSTLFEGAMAVIRQVDIRAPRTTKELWLKELISRRGKKVAAIALANKNVRTAYAMLKHGTNYEPTILAA
jgi:transposase